jgi:hypothetical protein
MNESAVRWIRGLPMRWGLGGLIILPAVLWLVLIAVDGIVPSSVDGWGAASSRIFVLIMLPLGVLGFVWGWSERLHLERCFAGGSDRFERAIHRFVLRQPCKSLICAAIFWVLAYGLGFESFRTGTALF